MKGNASRMVSLFGIVALGVMMLTGLMSIAPSMRSAAQKYYVQQNVFDLRVLSTLGLSEEDIAALAAQAAKLRHIERIQLNSVCRPPADSSVKPLTMARLEEIRSRMPGRCEIIASFPEKHTESGRTATEEDVRDLIERHPSTVDGTAAGLGISSGLSARLIASLKEKGVLREEERGDGTYYFLAEQRHD